MSSATVISPHREICCFPSQSWATTLGMTSGSKVKRGPAWPGNNRCRRFGTLVPPPPPVWLQSARTPVGGSWRHIDGRSKSGGEEQTRRRGADLGSELVSLNNQKPKRTFTALRRVLMLVLLWFPLLCGRLVFLHGAEKGRQPPPPCVAS